MFTEAKTPDRHAHRFRDTSAVTLLEKGVPMDRVQAWLGHNSSLKVTEKHYSPWGQGSGNGRMVAVVAVVSIRSGEPQTQKTGARHLLGF